MRRSTNLLLIVAPKNDDNETYTEMCILEKKSPNIFPSGKLLNNFAMIGVTYS